MRLLPGLFLAFAAALSFTPAAIIAPAWAQENTAPFSAMIFDGRYRLTVRHDGQVLKIAWRPLAQLDTQGALDTQVSAASQGKTLGIISGSQATFLESRAHIAVILDSRDPSSFYDQLAALRIMLAAAKFDRQSWWVFDAAEPAAPLVALEDETALETQWPMLTQRLTAPAQGSVSSLSPVIKHIALQPGDRKAMVAVPSAMAALQPGLSPRGIAGLQAFGISLYPLTYDADVPLRQAYETLAQATGGKHLAWLSKAPKPQMAAQAFRPLINGGTASFSMPARPWQPWSAPPPIDISITEGTQVALRTQVEQTPTPWNSLPWGGIAGLAGLFAGLAIAAIIWLRRQNKGLLHARLIDLSTKQSWELTRWPIKVGRGDDADITIANAHIELLHVRLSDTGSGLEIATVNDKARLRINGKEAQRQTLYHGADITLGTAPFKIEILQT